MNHIQKSDGKFHRKASINSDVCVCLCVFVSAMLKSSSRPSVALRALCRIQIDHLELRQVTAAAAAAARLLANHHLQRRKGFKQWACQERERSNHRSSHHTAAGADGDPAANPQKAVSRGQTLYAI